MKQSILLSLFVLLGLTTIAQFNTTITVQDASCSYSADGSYTIDSIQGCYAPLTLSIDSTTYTFESLVNNGYTYINHGAATGDDIVYSVWAGQTSAGPVYVATGTYGDSITFDSTTLIASGAQDMFIACFDATTSQLMWAKSGSGASASFTAGFAVTGAGNKAYVTGYFSGTTDFGGTSITSSGSYQGYIAKFDLPTGDVDTVIQIGGASLDEGYNIHYAAGRIYLLGDYQGSITLAGSAFTSAGGADPFIVVMDTTLSTSYWAASGGGSGLDLFTDVTTYQNAGVVEKVFLTGQFEGTANFGPNTLASAGAEDFFVTVLDTLGNFGWMTQGGSSNSDYCSSIDINSTGDQLYVGGGWQGTMTFGTQSYAAGVNYDGFIGYIDTAGVLDTIYALSGTGPDLIYDIIAGADDYITYVGQYGGDITYADSTFISNGNYDAFTAQVGPGLNEIWMKNIGGSQNDVFNSVYIGPDNRLHSGGAFRTDCSAYQSGLISAGGQDAMVTNEHLCGFADTTIVVSGLMGGSYTYTVSDSMGNTLVDTVTVGAPDTIISSGLVVDATSGTANDGSIDLSVTGGTPGYTYIWSNGAFTQDIDSLTAGNYCVTITDSNGCMDSTCFFVDSVLVVGPMTVTAQVLDVICFGDSSGGIDLTVAGGLPPYSFSWSNGASTEDLSGIVAGTYSVTVTDNDTASYIDSFVVDQLDEILLSGIVTPPTSGGSNDGAIDVTVTGGVPPFNFVWSSGQTTEDISGLSIGTYTITATDTVGCVEVRTFIVDTIASLSLVSIATDVTCTNTDNGMIDLTVVGGVPPFTYSWSNGATTEDLSGLSPGSYSVTVTDSLAQTATLTDSVGSNPIHPDPTVGPITGPASVQAFTTYNYSVPVTNGSVFDWNVSGGIVTTAASNASSIQWNAGPNGMLYVMETDANGCQAMDSLAITIIFVGIDETNTDAIVVYPNPTSDILNLRMPSWIESAHLRLIDLQGRILRDELIRSNTSTLDLGNVSSGSYVLRLNIDGTLVHHTIIVE